MSVKSKVLTGFMISVLAASVSAYAALETEHTVVTKTEETTMTTNDNESFLAQNKQKEGVVTLPDGLQYKILVKGTGAKPKASDSVKVHYAGSLVNGKEFDSSYTRGEPAVFPVNAVIPGWVEALQLMPVGSTWELYIPANLAYGERGAPPAIGPNETLIFKVQLLGIVS